MYNEVFNTLAKEDMDHMDEQESDFEVMQLLETEPVLQNVGTDLQIRRSVCRCSYKLPWIGSPNFFFSYYILKVRLYNSFEIKVIYKSFERVEIKVFLVFCLMRKGSVSGSIPLTNGSVSGCPKTFGSGKPFFYSPSFFPQCFGEI